MAAFCSGQGAGVLRGREAEAGAEVPVDGFSPSGCHSAHSGKPLEGG